jgi:hypothetical protein
MKNEFDVSKFDVKEYDRILACGLSAGLGHRGEQVCIEAAICQVLGLDHGDDPRCVTEAVRQFKIRLNDSRWSSAKARAEGLHDLGLAQLGSKGVVDDAEFAKRIAEKTIRVLIPTLFRDVLADKQDCLDAATRCENEGTAEAARNAKDVARKYASVTVAAAAAANANVAANVAANAYADYAAAAAVNAAVNAAANADYATDYANTYLNLSAGLALETLRELNSPGIALLETK